ncbi:MAG: septation ring formation regulator EzrA [Tenericutes bacterium]|nr:septation ring formation regulator EzrA [Mycoplasmatota bacterium]
MEDKTYIILGIAYLILAIILVVIVLVLINKHDKKKLQGILTNLELDKNLIISANILTELNKVGSLINNKNLEIKYNNWKERYKQIKEVDMPSLENKLNDLEALIRDKKYKDFVKGSSKLELEIYYIKSKSDFLLDEIREITLSESKNREIVTKLKKDYRDIYLKYNNSPSDYEGINNTIELQFENIDKLFNAFELAMENNDYSEASKIVKALTDNIGNIGIIIDEASSIILMGKKLIPDKIEDVKKIYDRMIKEGYLLDYLNIDYNISEAEKKLADIFDRLKVLNVNDSIIELKTILDYFDGLYGDFDKEVEAKKNYDSLSRKIAIKNKKLSAIIKNIISKIEDIKFSYDLLDEDVKVIDDLNLTIKGLQNDYDIIIENFRNKSFSYSQLYKELELINNRVSVTEEKVEQTVKFLSSLKDDEIRAREQLDEIKNILESSKEKMESFKLPIIPKDYYVELSEANDALDNMIDELNKKPISIRVLNLRVDTARDLVLKLHKNTSETIKNASLAESTIVYSNRFRYNNKINNALNRAEDYFYEGRYSEALELAIKAVSDVNPNIYNEVMIAKETIL